MDFVVGTIHMQGFARIFNAPQFTPNKKDHQAVTNQGQDIVNNSFTVLNDLLNGKEYIADHFTIADAALFYVEFWADRVDLQLPEHCRTHYQRMLKRPAVYQVLREEGYQIKAPSIAT
jgi:glutathione S-transferase